MEMWVFSQLGWVVFILFSGFSAEERGQNLSRVCFFFPCKCRSYFFSFQENILPKLANDCAVLQPLSVRSQSGPQTPTLVLRKPCLPLGSPGRYPGQVPAALCRLPGAGARLRPWGCARQRFTPSQQGQREPAGLLGVLPTLQAWPDGFRSSRWMVGWVCTLPATAQSASVEGKARCQWVFPQRGMEGMLSYKGLSVSATFAQQILFVSSCSHCS